MPLIAMGRTTALAAPALKKPGPSAPKSKVLVTISGARSGLPVLRRSMPLSAGWFFT
jgi:hypothetical protein